MKKIICVLLGSLLIFCASTASAQEKDVPKPSAAAYVLYCPQNGSIILSKNKDERRKPASTTKLMTTLLTLEQAAKGNKNVTFNKKMTAEGSSMYLEYGDTLKLDDLAAGQLNDRAVEAVGRVDQPPVAVRRLPIDGAGCDDEYQQDDHSDDDSLFHGFSLPR